MGNVTPNLGLHLTPKETDETTIQWCKNLNGRGASNIAKIDVAYQKIADKYNKIFNRGVPSVVIAPPDAIHKERADVVLADGTSDKIGLQNVETLNSIISGLVDSGGRIEFLPGNAFFFCEEATISIPDNITIVGNNVHLTIRLCSCGFINNATTPPSEITADAIKITGKNVVVENMQITFEMMGRVFLDTKNITFTPANAVQILGANARLSNITVLVNNYAGILKDPIVRISANNACLEGCLIGCSNTGITDLNEYSQNYCIEAECDNLTISGCTLTSYGGINLLSGVGAKLTENTVFIKNHEALGFYIQGDKCTMIGNYIPAASFEVAMPPDTSEEGNSDSGNNSSSDGDFGFEFFPGSGGTTEDEEVETSTVYATGISLSGNYVVCFGNVVHTINNLGSNNLIINNIDTLI